MIDKIINKINSYHINYYEAIVLTVVGFIIGAVWTNSLFSLISAFKDSQPVGLNIVSHLVLASFIPIGLMAAIISVYINVKRKQNHIPDAFDDVDIFDTSDESIKAIADISKKLVTISIDYESEKVYINDNNDIDEQKTVDSGFAYIEIAERISKQNEWISLEDALYFALSQFATKNKEYSSQLKNRVRLSYD